MELGYPHLHVYVVQRHDVISQELNVSIMLRIGLLQSQLLSGIAQMPHSFIGKIAHGATKTFTTKYW